MLAGWRLQLPILDKVAVLELYWIVQTIVENEFTRCQSKQVYVTLKAVIPAKAD